MTEKKKKVIYLSDIFVIGIAIFGLCFIFYKIVAAEDLRQAARIFIPTIALILFWYRAFKLNNLRKKRENLEEINFFEYYEESLEFLMKHKIFDVYIFLPLFKKEKTKELNRTRLNLNLMMAGFYFLLIIVILLK
jgi:hypothetical protein